MQHRLVIVFLIVSALFSGCAISPSRFYDNPQVVNGLSLCRTWANAEKNNSEKLVEDTSAELSRRGISLESCRTKNKVVEGAAVVGVIVGAVAVALAAANGGGGGGNYSPSDYDWAWDQFYSQGRAVWACRGKQTGRFAEQYHCSSKPLNDYTWPRM